MAENEKKSFSVDITSKAAEKAIDLAKDFLDKLIMPAVEELGLLIQDPIKIWRFNRQIKMLNDAREKCTKYNIKPKEIPVKLIFPLLEGASLEDDDYLLDKWSNLLTNLVDSDQNIQNHVFPYILSQISKNELTLLEESYDSYKNNCVDANQLEWPTKGKPYFDNELKRNILGDKIQRFELENILRLGLINERMSVKSPENNRFANNSIISWRPDYLKSTRSCHVTDLGLLFLKACDAKGTFK